MIMMMISVGCEGAVAIAINSDVCIADQLYAQPPLHCIIILITITIIIGILSIIIIERKKLIPALF